MIGTLLQHYWHIIGTSIIVPSASSTTVFGFQIALHLPPKKIIGLCTHSAGIGGFASENGQKLGDWSDLVPSQTRISAQRPVCPN